MYLKVKINFKNLVGEEINLKLVKEKCEGPNETSGIKISLKEETKEKIYRSIRGLVIVDHEDECRISTRNCRAENVKTYLGRKKDDRKVEQTNEQRINGYDPKYLNPNEYDGLSANQQKLLKEIEQEEQI